MNKQKTFWTDKVGQISLQKAPVVSPDTPIVEVVKVMQAYRIGCALVTDSEDKLVGIISHGDIMHHYVGSSLPGDVTADKLMTAKPYTISQNQTVQQVADIFHTNPFRHLPVLRKGQIMGVLSVRGLMTYIGEHLPKEVLNLPPDRSLIASEPGGG